MKHPDYTAIVVITLGWVSARAPRSSVSSIACCCGVCRIRTADRIVAIQEFAGRKTSQITSVELPRLARAEHRLRTSRRDQNYDTNLALSDQAERIDLAQTHADFFDVFGVTPQHGRLFIPDDEQAGHAPVAVLSHALWQRRFGGRPSLIGKPITLDGKNYTVIGVAPPGFQYPDKTECGCRRCNSCRSVPGGRDAKRVAWATSLPLLY